MRKAELARGEVEGELVRIRDKLTEAVSDRRVMQATVASVQADNKRLQAEAVEALAAKAKAEKEAVEANMNLQREVRAHTHTHTRPYTHSRRG